MATSALGLLRVVTLGAISIEERPGIARKIQIGLRPGQRGREQQREENPVRATGGRRNGRRGKL